MPSSTLAESSTEAATGANATPAETTGIAPATEPSPDDAQTPAAAKTKVDFRVGKWKLRKIPWQHMRLNNGKPIPIKTVGPQDARGVPMRPLGAGRSLVYNPTVLAQQGMKRLDSYRLTGNKVHLRQARKFADKLAKIGDGGKQRRWQPHRYDLGVHERGWVNSNSHGLTLSFLSRFYRLTGAKEKLREADRLFAAYQNRPDNQRWFSLITGADYIWFEHWPDGTNDHTLNAHINAIFGLYDYWLVTRDPLVERYLLGGIKTVRDKLYRFRRKGELSRYSLADKDGSLHYHETHIDQLRILARMTGDKWFARQADRFEKDEEAWKDKYRRNGAVRGR